MSFPIELSYAGIIGLLVIVMAILVKGIGYPDQIRKNYKRKSTYGLSTIHYIFAFLAYSLWVLHGINQKDTVLIIGQTAGVIVTGLVLFQIILYRKNHN